MVTSNKPLQPTRAAGPYGHGSRALRPARLSARRWTDELTTGDDDRIWPPREILRRYENGERDFRGLEIESPRGTTEPEFRGANLAGADFSESFIVADFSDANLQGARFAGNVKTCSFDRADLRNADFSGAAIDSATFDGADLTGANFDGATAYGYTYSKGECPGRERRPTKPVQPARPKAPRG